jgi:TonB family protein
MPADLLRVVWLTGAALGLASLVAGLACTAWRGSRAHPVADAERLHVLAEVTAELRIHRDVRLVDGGESMMPVTWGVFRPTVMLPSAARNWPQPRLRAVLQHELAHIRRSDWVVNLGVELVARVLWITPVMWIARRQVRLESERACDDAVLNLGADAAEYATHLMEVAREVRKGTAVGPIAPAMARAGLLERRIAAALNADVNRAPLSAPAVVIMLATLLAGAATLAGFGVPEQPRAPDRPLLDVQRDIMLRFGGEERRFSIVSRDVSFWSNRIQGRVELVARLNTDGSVTGVHLVEPVHPDLASAAETIVRGWRREPARVRGVPVVVPIRMTVDFRR